MGIMLEPLHIVLAVVYLSIGSCFFTLWLEFIKADTSLPTKDRLPAQVILVLATIFWPVIVPIAYYDLLKSKKRLN